MDFRILGPPQVAPGGHELRLGRSREQRVLAALLLDAGRVVPLHRLVDAVWDDAPPDKAAKVVRNCVSALRQRLGEPELIATEPAGYALRLADGRLDLQVFRDRVARARRLAEAGDRAEAVRLLRDASALWRGPALAGVPGRLIEQAADGLNEQRLAVLEECLAHELALGGGEDLVAELAALVVEHPLRERLRGQLMVALHRAGRRTDALDVYREGRRVLVEELGLEPGSELRDLERAVLNDDPALSAPTAASAASATARPPVPAQLPADAGGFVGRAGALAALAARLPADANGTAVTVVVGAPGVGKTTLAVHWAHEVRDRFPDGQLHIDLRGYAQGPPVRPIDALARFLTALGLSAEQVPVELEEAAATYRSLLAGRRVLVLLDNARAAEQVRPLLPGGPGCLVLVTSRDRLAGLVAGSGAHLVSLDVLDPAEAHELLVRTVGAARVDAEPAPAAELARLCAYLPLALRIAAAHLSHRRHRSIAGYVAELAGGDPLTALAADGDEHTAVQSAFDLSYAALPARARQVFRRLGLIQGADATTGAVAALAGIDDAAAAQALDRLAAAHLVDEPADGRFTFHDLLRRYAADRAHTDDDPAERAAATGRLFDWYLRTVESATARLYPEILRLPVTAEAAAGFADRAAALAWLDAERANLVAVAVHAAEHGPWRVAWLLADRLRGYFHQRMSTVDWLTVAQAGQRAAERDDAGAAQAAAALSLGDLHWRLSRYPEAVEHYTRAAGLAESAGWALGRVAVLGNLGNVYQQSGRLDLATERYREALDTAVAAGWVAGEAANLENLGAAYWELGQLAEAADFTARAVAICEANGSRFSQAVSLTGLAEVCHALGDLDAARDHATTALALHREVGNRGGEAETVRVQALIEREWGRHDRALDLARAALALAREAGDRRYEADALNTVASVQELLGEHRPAVETYRRALRLAREIGNGYPEVEALIGLAGAYRCLGRAPRATAFAQEALALAHRMGYGLLESRAATGSSAWPAGAATADRTDPAEAG